MKNKKIKFISSHPEFNLPHPVPASKIVPNWYRKMPITADKVETVKKCVPVLDALTAGYVITLPADIYYDSDEKSFSHNSHIQLNQDHHQVQTQDVEIGEEFDSQPHKWLNQWVIKTPKGYSCLFIHPLNRTDLPFRSFTGIVDTDRHPLVINFPFVMKKKFNGIISAGTPIIQVIPFKRDSWNSEIIDDKEFKEHPEAFEVENPPFNWYKRKWWIRKTYS